MKINKEPVYKQLTTLLRRRIVDEFSMGDKFLTESEISSLYGISRNTVNKALSSLIGEGYLESRKGLGTFVKRKESLYDLHNMMSFTSIATSMGRTPSTKVLFFEALTQRDKEEQLELPWDKGEGLYKMRRLRLLDGKPSILEKRYVSARLSPDLKESDITSSILTMWKDKYGLSLGRVDQSLKAVLLNDEEAGLLHCHEGDPAFLRQSTGFTTSSEILWFEKTLFPGKDYLFHFHIDSVERGSLSIGKRDELNS